MASEFEKELENRGFKISRKCLNSELQGLYIDDINKKWTITGSNMKKLRRFDYSQILDFELFENGTSIQSGRSGGALIGGLLAGTTGAIIGGSGRKKISEKIRTYQLRISVDDIKQPSITFDFIGFMGVDRDSAWFVEVTEKAHEMTSLLTYMMNKAK